MGTKRKGTTMKKKANGKRAVVVTTAKRGVFFGYSSEKGPAIIRRGDVTLVNARMCSYWSAETHGVMGLAGIGPQKGSRIGPRVPEITCESVTAVMVCTPEASAAWEGGPWS
jgi:hypothetical protein